MSDARSTAEYQPASFRGVSFFVADSDVTIGRRSIVHEYPLKDTPYTEDLGKAARTYTLNAYVMGDDAWAQAREIIKAVEDDPTPGVLIHPTLGRRNVIPKDCRSVFTERERRIAYITLTFVDSGENQFPQEKVDTQANASIISEASIEKLKSSFSDLYATEGFQDNVAEHATNLLVGSSNLSEGGSLLPPSLSFVGVLTGVLGRYAGDATSYSTLRNTITDFQNTIGTKVTSPTDLASSVADMIAQLKDVYVEARTLIAALKRLYDEYGANIPMLPLTTLAVPVATPDREQLVINQAQIIDLVHEIVLMEMVKAMAAIEFDSREDALALLADIESRMQPKLTYLGDALHDEPFIALSDANTSMVLDVKTRAATLRTIAYVTLNVPLPALVLAYREYQDATQEADIVARNNVRNPVFVPAGYPLEILV